MVISSIKMKSVIDSLRRFGARRILLFGSYAETPEKAQDVDLAVEGIPLARLLDADVAVSDILAVPCDLVSREENPDFFKIIQNSGKVLYEEG
ncbi:MAG: hypothetical protein A2268_12665 [Candidatus Raymondbacteria bacterium RifOxyA12_full_50_37]|uniref:Polymerase beta nucleotidyltransferase domain-containing protein n=1 Tax=Candidatus Raymondbacteria bacterium RIFOXYD12_FULL_49_13 TaxID=1817890 RepID=A0A1F7FBA1_UNCRA|nr:MAG: hypothetical protein A2268_12665 [Candidatus Raymondbacteria bacterium RifOxyA12_full_50_37]OGJ91028.1 MAG: hypothetical protein A2248_00685 [Candidatus Raymondbacteria bacterium RIFOXYA2_FULL_49_16]OGJ97465.1 MAG: hypothetical protein A2453_10235 [Candidatus Raymondbacteria bacterium RIFOXYC2_FULL_50_21]OGJ97789.1 MAG: hypothetical protein A2487_13230 [Candidatus Raymondbacteria bacterium RifOxyC12_full_50_8]OGJ99729.1 MAG: hypothetical protein A2350_08940 [Candidatus Raymondbacteria b